MAVLRPGETAQVVTRGRAPLARLVTARPGRPTLTARVVGGTGALAVAAPTTVLTPRPGAVSRPADGSGGGGGTVIGGAIRCRQTTPAAVWHWDHGLGRIPKVDVFVVDPATGLLEDVDADIVPTATDFTITFSSPVTGEAIVN